MEGAFSEVPVNLADGQTRMGSNILDNEIPVPLCDTKAHLSCAYKQCRIKRVVVSFAGSGAELQLLGEPEFVEEFRP